LENPGAQPERSALSGALDALWTRFLPEIESRIAVLEAAAEASRASGLSAQRQAEAQSAAHKLAGVLGTFGLTRGTELAREVETVYSQQGGIDSAQAEALLRNAAELRTLVAGRK